MKSKRTTSFKKRSSIFLGKKAVATELTDVLHNHIIPRYKADIMIKRFEENQADLNKVFFYSGRVFHKSLFEKFLKLKGIETLQFRNAVDDTNAHTLVITATNKIGEPLYFTLEPDKTLSGEAAQDSIYGVGNMGSSCPSYPMPINNKMPDNEQ